MNSKNIYKKVFESELNKADQAKIAICSGAFELIEKEGVRSLSFQKIGDACDMKKSLVRYYFQSITDILICMLKYSYINAQEITIDHLDQLRKKPAETQVLGVVRGAFDWAKRYPREYRFTLLISSLGIHEVEVQKVIKEVRSTGWERIQGLIKENYQIAEPKCKKISHEIQMIIQGALFDHAVLNRCSLSTYEKRTNELVKKLLEEIAR